MNQATPNSILNNFGMLLIPSIIVPLQAQSDFYRNFADDGGMNTRGDLPNKQGVMMSVIDYAGHAKLAKVGGSFGKSVSPSLSMRQIQAPTYQVTSEFMFEDDAANEWMNQTGTSYYETMQLACDTAHINTIGVLAMMGGGGANEGLFNAAGIATVTALLATDTAGATNLELQNAAEIQEALLNNIRRLLNTSLISHGYEKPTVSITSSRRTDQQFDRTVSLLNSPGNSGLFTSIRNNIEATMSGVCNIEWITDDISCLNLGTSGTGYDRMLMQIKEKPMPLNQGKLDVNTFGNQLQNQTRANSQMFLSTDTPRYIEAAVGFSTHVRVIMEAVTSGWMPRPMATKIADVKVS